MTQEPALIGSLAVVVVVAFIAIASLLLGVSMAGNGVVLRSLETLWRWLISDLSLMIVGLIVILGVSIWLTPYIGASGSPGGPTGDAPPTATISATPPPTPPTAAVTYVVRKGDTLRTIAAQLLGDESAWTRIYAANRPLIPDPDALVIGTRLTIPPR
ncbi:MAG TPA: LysM peptidoglycan-binding domain-containing protein [Candidatus Limnocylindria bacterium]|nr:LysM peptidoglycan-binding domain-containing protein [Candidatus Limnocylindria bacterium]